MTVATKQKPGIRVLKNPHETPEPEKHHQVDYEVIVIGAGFSGIGAGIKLKQEGISFRIFEKAGDLGGTWRDNTYPGIAVDITSFTYSFSFEQNPNWSRIFAPGNELQRYANHCVDKYNIRQHMQFDTTIDKAVFNEKENYWAIFTTSGDEYKSRFLITATGGLTQPKLPEIDGIKDFKGKLIHTARWPHDYDLAGKRVAVIGTGATSVQLVPAIAPLVKTLDVYQRTAIWILPKPDAEIPQLLQWVFENIPGAQDSIRTLTTMITEMVMVMGIIYHKQTPFLIKAIQQFCLQHLKNQVKDPELRKKLTPTYDFGCKRPSFSSDYYLAFNRENVSLVTDSIAKVTEDGIVTKDGTERKIDVLITATGFKVYEKGNTPPFKVYGLDGLELGDFWDKNRYQAYEGASVPHFPNMFLIWGPYSASGSSWFSMIEAQVNHAIRCLNYAHKKNANFIEVKKKAHDDYFEDILRRQENTVFYNSDCTTSNSYYFDKHGDAPFYRPSTGVEMWLRSRLFNLNHYTFSNKGSDNAK